MGRQTYTNEELYHLRSSPLVQRPERLPPVEQWIDAPVDREPAQQRKAVRTQNGRPSDDSGPMGNFGSQRPSLVQSRQGRVSGEDIVLGPPKMSFASSRNGRRGEDEGFGGNEGEDFSLEAISSRTRNYGDEDGGRRRGFGMEDKEGWTTARRGKPYETRPGEKEKTFARGTRGERYTPGGDDSGRRNGLNAREDTRWSREGEDRKPTRTMGRETASWRDREHRPERDYGRDAHAEKEPEWMDGPLVDDEPVARTAAEFEKWKAKMRGHKADESQDSGRFAAEEPETSKAPASVFADPSFGTWGEAKKSEASARPEQAPVTPAASKKASRFASMFAPKEEARSSGPEPAPEAIPGLSATPSADQEAFQRMLSKLRVGPMGPQNPSAGISPGSENRSTPNPLIQSILTGKPDSRPGSTQAMPQTRPPHSREQSNQYGPGEAERKTPALSKDSEFLLNLIQMKSASRPPQSNQKDADPNFQLFLDQPPRGQPQGPPPPRGPMPQGPMQSPPEHPFSPARAGDDGPGDRRQPATQPPPGFFDGPPPGQHRPPGFGPPMGPPPDFFRHDPNQGPPPPGFMGGPPHPLHHGPPPPVMFGNGPPPPPHILQQQQQQRGPPPGMPTENPYGPAQMQVPPGFPPGFMPPPGFNGPPPPGGPPGMRPRMDIPVGMQEGRGQRPR